MVMEIFGLPASGKTTLAREIEMRCGLSLISTTSKWKLIIYNLFFFLRYPVFSLVTLYYIVRESHSLQLLYSKCVNTFLHRNARYIESRRRKEGGIIDEGHLQNILSLFNHTESRSTISFYIRLIPKVDHYILMDIDEEERKSFIHERGYEGREAFNEALTVSWREAIKVNTTRVIEIFPSTLRTVIKNLKESDKVITRLCVWSHEK